MDQVISNLISNAIKYGSSKEIRIDIDSCRHRPSLTVQDFGIGIPVQDQKRIFERFERSHSARNISGFGLGLFVVKQIIDGHGGTVEVQSEPNAGSKFTVYLPTHANYLELQ
jgi:signal transduction histidine kinase